MSHARARDLRRFQREQWSRIWTQRRLHGAYALSDVGMSSLGNFALAAVAARAMDLTEFGAFSVCFLLGIVATGFSRALCSDPLTLRYSAESDLAQRSASRAVLGAAVAVGTCSMPILVVVAWLVLMVSGGEPAASLRLGLITGIVIPGLVLQEAARGVAYSRRTPGLAAGNTAVRSAIVAVLLGVVGATGTGGTPETMLGVWGISATGGAIAGCWLLRDGPRLAATASWFRENGRLTRQLALDFSLTLTTAEGSMLLISAVGGTDSIGAIRKALLPMAPLTLLTTGALVLLQPVLVRRVARGVGRLQLSRFAHLVAAGMGVVGAVWCVILMAAPSVIMTSALGAGWEDARELLPATTLYLFLGALAGLLGVTLRALGSISTQVAVRAVLAPVTLASVFLVTVRGPQAAMLCLCVNLLVVVVAWEMMVHRLSRDVQPGRPAGEG